MPSVVHDVTVPPESTASGTTVHIIDSSSNVLHRGILRQKVRIADCILALYDVTRLETLDSLHQEWLPLIRDLFVSCGEKEIANDNRNLKVIVVGTKIDLLGESMGTEDIRRSDERNRLASLFHEFDSIIRLCDRCSAKLLNVDNVFYHGELVVAFPIEPLYNQKLCKYTPEFSKALRRIFRIIDLDKDGLLSDHELNQLEITCFNHILRDQEMEMIKRRMYHTSPSSFEHGKLTPDGFFGMMHLFIDRSFPQIPWAILERFGYNDKLCLESLPKSLRRCTSDDLKVHNWQCHVELSNNAVSFLMGLMNSTSGKTSGVSNTHVLSSAINEIFSVLPEEQRIFWKSEYIKIHVNRTQVAFNAPENDVESISMHESYEERRIVLLRLSESTSYHTILSQFQVLATLRPYLMKLLLYQLGFAEHSDLGLKYINPLNESFPHKSHFQPRKMVHVAVFGTKPWLMVDLIHGKKSCHKDPQEVHCLTSCGCANFVGDELYYFVFTEISMDAAKSIPSDYTSFDIVLLQFDSSSADSLEVLKSVDLSLPALPRLFVATNLGNFEHEKIILNARIHLECSQQADIYLLDDSDVDNENSGESLDKICTQIVRLVHDPEKGIPLSRMNSHSLSIRTIGLVLIPPLLVTIGIIASRSKQGLRVYLKRGLEYLSFFSRCND